MPAAGWDDDSDTVVLDAFSHYGTRNPPDEVQAKQADTAEMALLSAGVEFSRLGGGITIHGGTPAHRWLRVTVNGVAMDLKVLAANDAEVEEQLEQLAVTLGVPDTERGRLDVLRPSRWPPVPLFALPGHSS